MDNRKELTEDDVTCPLTGQIFLDPVKIKGGVTVERQAIETWLKDKGTNPFNRQALNISDLTPDEEMKQNVLSFLKLHPKKISDRYTLQTAITIQEPITLGPSNPTEDDLVAMAAPETAGQRGADPPVQDRRDTRPLGRDIYRQQVSYWGGSSSESQVSRWQNDGILSYSGDESPHFLRLVLRKHEDELGYGIQVEGSTEYANSRFAEDLRRSGINELSPYVQSFPPHYDGLYLMYIPADQFQAALEKVLDFITALEGPGEVMRETGDRSARKSLKEDVLSVLRSIAPEFRR